MSLPEELLFISSLKFVPPPPPAHLSVSASAPRDYDVQPHSTVTQDLESLESDFHYILSDQQSALFEGRGSIRGTRRALKNAMREMCDVLRRASEDRRWELIRIQGDLEDAKLRESRISELESYELPRRLSAAYHKEANIEHAGATGDASLNWHEKGKGRRKEGDDENEDDTRKGVEHTATLGDQDDEQGEDDERKERILRTKIIDLTVQITKTQTHLKTLQAHKSQTVNTLNLFLEARHAASVVRKEELEILGTLPKSEVLRNKIRGLDLALQEYEKQILALEGGCEMYSHITTFLEATERSILDILRSGSDSSSTSSGGELVKVLENAERELDGWIDECVKRGWKLLETSVGLEREALSIAKRLVPVS